MSYKLWLTVIIVVLFILTISSMVQYIPAREGEPARLSFVFGKSKPVTTCTGKLVVNGKNLGNGKCSFQADVTMKNCEGKTWYVFQGDRCGGILVCNHAVNQPVSIWKCKWKADEGAYTFALCADNELKATSTMAC